MDLKPFFFFFLILLSWHIVSTVFFIEAIFPPPILVMKSLIEIIENGQLASDICSSALRLAFGLILGTGSGVVVGLSMYNWKTLDHMVSPFLNILRAFPPVALLPLMIVWFGISDLSKIISIASAVFFPVWLSTLVGVKDIPKDYLKVASIYSTSKKELFTKIILPSSLPFIVSGIRIGIAIAFVMVFVSELAGSSSGLGYFIANSQITYRIDRMLAGLIVLGSFAAGFDLTFQYLVKRTFPWLNV